MTNFNDILHYFNHQDVVLELTTLLVLVGYTVANLELIWNWKEFREGGLFSWKIWSMRIPSEAKAFKSLLNKILGYPGILIVLIIRQIIILACFFFIYSPNVIGLLLWLLVCTTLLINYRNPFGNEGADQMSLVIISTVAIGWAFSNNQVIVYIILLFITTQLILSYFLAGIAKVSGSSWRNGDALGEIINSGIYGTPKVGKLLKSNPLISKVINWFVLIFEITFPLILFLPNEIAILYILGAFIFHLMTSILMGLNGFVWTYTAAIPSVIYIIF